MSMTVAVVIPYYQREPGILRRAVASVLAQQVPAGVSVRILIVDDESPLPSGQELQDLVVSAPFSITLLSRPNGGPGAARNTALDHLDWEEDAQAVAFLDSDDVWYPEHLATALLALENGADFFFSNSIHDDRTSFSYFTYMSERHDLAANAEPVTRTVSAQEAFDAFVVHCIPHTSQVVYDFAKHPNIRFDTSLRRTGEDQLFWIELARQSERVTYHTGPMGSRGEGVSIYREALSWDSVNAPNRLIDGLVFRHKLATSFALHGRQKVLSENEAQETRDHLLFLCIRNLRYRPRNTVDALVRVSRDNPTFWLHLPKTFLRIPGHYRKIAA